MSLFGKLPEQVAKCVHSQNQIGRERDREKTGLLASAELKDTCISYHLHLAFCCTTLKLLLLLNDFVL